MANQIKKYRETAKMKQAELAKALDVSIDTLWRWENGSGEPRWSDIKIMCKLFDCIPEYLMSENPTLPSAESEVLQGETE